jgi:hypothetical protein
MVLSGELRAREEEIVALDGYVSNLRQRVELRRRDGSRLGNRPLVPIAEKGPLSMRRALDMLPWDL